MPLGQTVEKPAAALDAIISPGDRLNASPLWSMCDMAEISQSQAVAAKGRLLIVDDDPRLRGAMGEMIRDEGYSVEEAGTGEDALELLKRASFDLMTVDMMMPGIGGVEVIRHARQIHPDLAIIVLTGNPTIESAIASVKADVTDYLLKPYTGEDLLLAISKAIQERMRQRHRQHLLAMVGEVIEHLRQPEEERIPAPVVPPTPSEHSLRVGALALDREKRTAIVHAQPPRTVELTEGEAAILTTLMKTPNQVFTYSQLADAALGYKDMDKWTVESIVRSSVFRLRQKIEANSDDPKFIRTVRGRGYFFSPV
ncbi:MAG: response regulator transcription factor [Chloroflexota bacterium]